MPPHFFKVWVNFLWRWDFKARWNKIYLEWAQALLICLRQGTFSIFVRWEREREREREREGERERERECIGFGTNGDWEGESVWKRQWLWVGVGVGAHVFVCECVYLGVASDSPVLIILAKKLNVLSEESDLNCFYQGFVTSLRISKKIQKMHFCCWVGFKKLIYFLTKFSYQTWWPSSEARLPEKPKNPSARAIDISLLC